MFYVCLNGHTFGWDISTDTCTNVCTHPVDGRHDGDEAHDDRDPYQKTELSCRPEQLQEKKTRGLHRGRRGEGGDQLNVETS